MKGFAAQGFGFESGSRGSVATNWVHGWGYWYSYICCTFRLALEMVLRW